MEGSIKKSRTKSGPARLSACAQVVALLCSALAAAQDADAPANANVKKTEGAFSEAKMIRGDVPPDAAAFEFESGGYAYRVAANGNGRGTKGKRVGRFNLRLDGRDYIESVYFSEYEGDLVLACGVTNEETGGGIVVRLEQPSMRSLWKRDIPAFNVGEPLREGRRLYVTGIGFVGALDLSTGAYIWKHADLYGRGRRSAFNSFDLPELRGEEVLFKERPAYNGRPQTIFVNKKTGKILRIE